jgi:hypothetical protein
MAITATSSSLRASWRVVEGDDTVGPLSVDHSLLANLMMLSRAPLCAYKQAIHPTAEMQGVLRGLGDSINRGEPAY